MEEGPGQESFKLSRWERKNNLIKENEQELNNSFQDERSPKKRNIPRSSRRKY